MAAGAADNSTRNSYPAAAALVVSLATFGVVSCYRRHRRKIRTKRDDDDEELSRTGRLVVLSDLEQQLAVLGTAPISS
jgi:hypothetical protein